MTEKENDLKNLIDKLDIDTNANSNHRENLRQKMLAAFEESPKPTRSLHTLRSIIMKTKTTKLAAAAIIIIAVLLGLKLIAHSNSEKPEKTIVSPLPQPSENDTINEQNDYQQQLAAAHKVELETVNKLFTTSDVNGLLAVLTEAQFDQSKAVAANYLAKIGDSRAIEPLENLAAQWTGNSQENPFVRAIADIELRSPTPGLEDPPHEVPPENIPQTPNSKQKAVLSGHIADADTGEPVKGVQVGIRFQRTYRTETDANGFYAFDEVDDNGSYIVTLFSTDYMWVGSWKEQPVLLLHNDTPRVENFTLKIGCQINVEVVDQNDNALDDVSLYVTWTGQRYGREVNRSRRRVLTDKDGQALLGAFEPSNTPYLITARDDNYAPAKAIVKLTDPNLIEYARITMQKGLTIEGNARYEDGTPVSNSRGNLHIQAIPKWWSIPQRPGYFPIDPNGNFILTHIMPGDYVVYLYTKRDTGGGSATPVLNTTLPPEKAPLFVKIPGKGPESKDPTCARITIFDQTDPGPVSITGTITSSSEELGKVDVTAYSTDGQRHKGRVEDKKFSIDSLKPGIYRIAFSGGDINHKSLWNITAPSNNIDVRLTDAETPELTGSVVQSQTNEPIQQFSVRLIKLKRLRGAGSSERDVWKSFSDPLGKFSFKLRGSGIYKLQIIADGFAPAVSDPINTDEDNKVVIRMSKGGSINGIVINEDGLPVSKAKVIPLSKAGGNHPSNMYDFVSEANAVETTNGTFLLNNLPAGTEILKVIHPDYASAIVKDIEVADGETTENMEIILGKGCIVEGHVYDEKGNPQSGELLYFEEFLGRRRRGKPQRFAAVASDANGYYRAEHLPERPCLVKRAKYNEIGVVHRTVAPDKDKTIQLDFGGPGIISGRITIGETPLANTKLILADPYNRSSYSFAAHITTDFDGQFMFVGVPPDMYGIYYKVPIDKYSWYRIRTVTMDENTLDLGDIEIQTGEIQLTVTFDHLSDDFDATEIFLQKGNEYWGTRIGKVFELSRHPLRYLITDVPTGKYYIVAKRFDRLQLMKEISFNAESGRLETTWQIPACSASVSGTSSSIPAAPLYLRREDGNVLDTLSLNSDGTYRIEGLPPGTYSIGGLCTITNAPLARFNINESEHVQIDLEPSSISWLNVGSLHTQTLNENSSPLTEARVWLENETGRVNPFKTNEDGQYFFTDPGEYLLVVSCPGYETTSQHLYLPPMDFMGTGFVQGTHIIRLEKE